MVSPTVGSGALLVDPPCSSKKLVRVRPTPGGIDVSIDSVLAMGLPAAVCATASSRSFDPVSGSGMRAGYCERRRALLRHGCREPEAAYRFLVRCKRDIGEVSEARSRGR